MSDKTFEEFEVGLIAVEWSIDQLINQLERIMDFEKGEEWADFDAELREVRNNFMDAYHELAHQRRK